MDDRSLRLDGFVPPHGESPRFMTCMMQGTAYVTGAVPDKLEIAAHQGSSPRTGDTQARGESSAVRVMDNCG